LLPLALLVVVTHLLALLWLAWNKTPNMPLYDEWHLVGQLSCASPLRAWRGILV